MANLCPCGEHQQMMDVSNVIEAAAAGIAAALRSCKCDGNRGLLLEALELTWSPSSEIRQAKKSSYFACGRQVSGWQGGSSRPQLQV